MSVDRNFGRTLSGATDIAIDNLRLGDNINSIRINGNAGLPNQVIAKNGTTGKLEWDFVETTTIPDGSITGNKLANNINISTTGSIDANTMRTNSLTLPKTGTAETVIDSDGINLVGTRNITIDDGNFDTANGDMIIRNGGDLIGFSDTNSTKTVDIDTATGDIKVYNPSNGNERIELDGTTGNLIINDGGRLDMFLGNTLNIELNGVNGIIDCRGLVLRNHTGLITFDRMRCDTFNANTISIPEDPANQGGTKFLLTDDLMTFSNPFTISGSTSNATFKTLTLAGGSGVADSLVCLGSITTGTDTAGNTGGVKINTGDLDVIAGNGIFRGGADFIGDNAVDIIDSNSDLQFRFAPSTGNFVAGTGDITATAGNLVATAGNITATAGEIKSGRVGSKPAPDDSTYTEWALNLSDDNSHGYVGGNLIVNGNIYGNVEGTITEEIIDAQRLNLREDPTGATSGDIELNMNVATGQNGRINQIYETTTGNGGYKITIAGAEVFEITKGGNINRCENIIMRGSIFNNVNSANFLMGVDNARMSSTSSGNNSNDKLVVEFGGSSDDSVIKVRDNNNDRVVISKDGIDFNADLSARLSIDSDTGDINFKNTLGDINGYSASTPNGFTNMTMFDQSNQLPHPRFVQICDPTIHSVYTFTSGTTWKNMAGYTDNNTAKPRYTNADLSFTAFSTTGRMNVIFSASVNNNMGVRFRIVEINGASAGIPITGTQRLFIGSSAHRGQHEYTCYYNGFTLGYNYTITPEIYVGGSSSITMYVGSKNGSATIQDADSPIITEISFMNRATINTGNIYIPPSDDY